ncbi:acyl carrier protein [Mycolicibacterium moriokaense]|nr:acyl carrier protein [Mycolicibacterium moriokaense]
MTADRHQDLVEWLTTKVAGYVHLPPDAIDTDRPLADCGVDSALGLTLCADLLQERGLDVETTVVWDFPTIEALADYLVGERSAP